MSPDRIPGCSSDEEQLSRAGYWLNNQGAISVEDVAHITFKYHLEPMMEKDSAGE